MHTGRMLHVGRVIPQDAHMPAGRMPHVGRHIPQDAHISTGRTHARRMHTYLQDAHMPAGCTHAHRTHTRSQDAHKGRPYYGRGIDLFAHVSRKSHVGLACWPGLWT